MQHLQPNTTLQGGKYRIERVLGQGGFGNTYVGYNTEFEETVAIKEFFMQGINDREEATGTISIGIERNRLQFEEQKAKFKKEALRIRRLDNPHIVKVHDLFEENGTAYYVMDYVDGENLAQRMKRTGKPISEKKVREILPQLLDALKAVHDAGIWHLDLKPANIMLDKAGNVKLIDFGASKQLDAQKGGATSSTAISYTNGYAPREQMEQNYDKFGPWTDIYALGATLYNLLTNKRPPLPSDIDDDETEDKHYALPFPERISIEMKRLILRMMNTSRTKRPQSIAEINLMSKEDDDNEETILADDFSKIKKSEEADNRPDYTNHPDQFDNTYDSAEDDSSTGNGLYVIVGIVVVAIVVFLLYRCNSDNGTVDNTEIEELVDSVDTDYWDVDTLVDNSSEVLNGYHSEIYDNGKYEGEWKDGLQHGNGTYTWNSGDKYVGEWKNGERTGKGIYTFANADDLEPYKYVGDFVNGQRTGYGTEYLVGGDFYEGYFKDGNYHGKGTYYDAEDYTYQKGIWENNKLINKIEEGTWTR